VLRRLRRRGSDVCAKRPEGFSSPFLFCGYNRLQHSSNRIPPPQITNIIRPFCGCDCCRRRGSVSPGSNILCVHHRRLSSPVPRLRLGQPQTKPLGPAILRPTIVRASLGLAACQSGAALPPRLCSWPATTAPKTIPLPGLLPVFPPPRDTPHLGTIWSCPLAASALELTQSVVISS